MRHENKAMTSLIGSLTPNELCIKEERRLEIRQQNFENKVSIVNSIILANTTFVNTKLHFKKK